MNKQRKVTQPWIELLIAEVEGQRRLAERRVKLTKMKGKK